MTAVDPPPEISGGEPSGTLPAGTTSATLGVVTSEAATGKWGGVDVEYAKLANTFTTTGGTSHSGALTGLVDGQSYVRYVRCQDGAGNANSSSYAVSFSVALPPDTAAPVVRQRLPSPSTSTPRPTTISRRSGIFSRTIRGLWTIAPLNTSSTPAGPPRPRCH